MLRCLNKEILHKYNDDNLTSNTSEEQKKVEESVEQCYDYVRSNYNTSKEVPKLLREKHVKYLTRGLLQPLQQSFECLDASRPWLTYWILHSLSIIDENVTLELNAKRITDFVNKCLCSEGGYGGGPSQISHLATTYAAINALVSLSNEYALKSINRVQLKNFLFKMKQNDGSFKMHSDGEIDIRGAYCAASVAQITNLLDDELFENTSDWIAKCQTYEGGFGAAPGHEAHGGYTFCAIAALVFLKATHKCNLNSLLRWVVNKQQKFEGGFAGRTNKLVDGCYSFWQAAILPIIHTILVKQSPHLLPTDKWLFNQQALQEYLLCCCQENNGGLIDKPGRHRDFYHTCYDLSGLSITQHSMLSQYLICNNADNKVVRIHPLFNLTIDCVRFANEYFAKYLC